MRLKSAVMAVTGLAVLTAVAGIGVGLTGCVPPKPGMLAGNGHAIIQINPQKRPPFKTVTLDGVEYMQARGPLGKFGGTFYSIELGDGPKTFNPIVASDATSTL